MPIHRVAENLSFIGANMDQMQERELFQWMFNAYIIGGVREMQGERQKRSEDD